MKFSTLMLFMSLTTVLFLSLGLSSVCNIMEISMSVPSLLSAAISLYLSIIAITLTVKMTLDFYSASQLLIFLYNSRKSNGTSDTND